MSVIKVFISSTFIDLEDERREVKKAIEEFNPAYENFDIHLYPVDLRNGARPNPSKEECLNEVSKCHVLVGIIGSRYGYIDPDSGKSITELEYECAINNSIPCLFYISNSEYIKKEWIESETHKRELDRFKCIVDGAHKRDVFEKPEELRGHIYRDLARLLNEKFIPHTEDDKEANVSSLKSVESQNPSTDLSIDGGDNEIVKTFNTIKQAIEKNDEISIEEKERLYLFANGLFYNNKSYGIIGNHEIHRIYLIRKQINLYVFESKHILKTLLSDEYNVKTGWYFLANLKTKLIRWYFKHLSVESEGEEQKKYFRELSRFWPSDVILSARKVFNNSSQEVVRDLLPIITETGSDDAIKLVESINIENDDKLRIAKKKTLLSLNAITSKQKPLLNLIMELTESESQSLNQEISKALSLINLAFLRDIDNKHSVNGMKLLAKTELAKRNKLESEECFANLKSSDLNLRFHCYLNLIERGELFDPNKIQKEWPESTLATRYFGKEHLKEKILETLFNKMSLEELESHIDWISVYSPLAYKVYGLREYESIKSKIKADLLNSFSRIRDDYFNKSSEMDKAIKEVEVDKNISPEALIKLKSFFKEQMKVKMNEKLQKLDGFIISGFKKAALEVIYQKGKMDDKEFLIREINAEGYAAQEIAKKLFIKSATKDDIDYIYSLTTGESNNIKVLAGQKALQLDADGEIKSKFMLSGDEDLIKIVFAHSIKLRENVDFDTINELMYTDSNNIRVLAVAYLLKIGTTKKKFEKILEEYPTKRHTYYYNVISWIDKILYSPKTIKSNARKELVSRLEVKEVPDSWLFD